MKKRRGPLIAAALLIVVIAIIVAAGLFLDKYRPSTEHENLKNWFHTSGGSEAAIVVDGVVMDSLALVEGGRVYVDIDTAKDVLNDRFYYDDAEKLFIYASSDVLYTASAGESGYYIGNDLKSAAYPVIIEENGQAYIEIDFAKSFSAFKYESFSEPDRVVIEIGEAEFETVTATANTELRVKGGIKSNILTDVEKGRKLYVVEEFENWTKVFTEDGFLGFVQNKRVSEASTEKREISSNMYEDFSHNHLNDDVVLLWHQVTNTSANRYVTSVLSQTSGVNVISPTWFYLNDSDGNIADLASSDYVSYCHERGVQVWALCSNLENPGADTTEVLTHTTKRQCLVNQLVAKALSYNLDGINIDFEALKGEVSDSFIQFIRELSIKCRANNIILSVDNYPPSAYTNFYNRKEQNLFADYVIIMGYDEHYSGSDEGSVASIGYVENAVKNTIAQGVDPSNIILGMPFYTRMWELTPKGDESDSAESTKADYKNYTVDSEALSMAEARKRIEANGADITWLPD
nr:glycosyl hydrolase family 18 [Lachnospiraceae bacterium]